ncbi:hypothetical protein B0H14DRAFT_3906987, partial [Mycena olivaceomarginata]
SCVLRNILLVFLIGEAAGGRRSRPVFLGSTTPQCRKYGCQDLLLRASCVACFSPSFPFCLPSLLSFLLSPFSASSCLLLLLSASSLFSLRLDLASTLTLTILLSTTDTRLPGADAA